MPSRLKVLILPGLDGTGRLLRSFASALSPTIEPQIVTYPADAAWDYDELANFVAAEIPTNEQFALLAESFSGPLAVRLAARRPRGLTSVVLVNSFILHSMRWVPAWASAVVGSYLFWLVPPAWVIRYFGSGPDSSEQLNSEIRAALREVKPHVLACRLRVAMAVNVTPDFLDLSVPMLYLAGTEDWMLAPNEVAKALRKLRPDLEIASLPAPHFLLQRCPEEAARMISKFLLRSAKEAG